MSNRKMVNVTALLLSVLYFGSFAHQNSPQISRISIEENVITIDFPQREGRSHIAFSKDGGENYESVPLSAGTFSFTDLEDGTYDVWARWGNGAYPVKIGTYTISPDIFHIPVTFRDFHSDRSNPEFEPYWVEARVVEGMVQDTLDHDGKPVLGPNPNNNVYIKYWYRDWADSARGDFSIPRYEPCETRWLNDTGERRSRAFLESLNDPATSEFMGDFDTLDHDTAFKNITIPCALPFEHIGNGVYRYENQNFFPLDDRGFGPEWTQEYGDNTSNNFSFTMELDWMFEMRPGLEFDFIGDDDVWVFINGRLAMDLGGIHGPEEGQINLDEIADEFGLEIGQNYSFKMFYAERRTVGSTIRVTTNLFYVPPEVITIDITPSTTIRAGDTVSGRVVLFSDDGEVLTDLEGVFEWGYVDLYADNPQSTFSGDAESMTFSPEQAYTEVLIWGEYTDTLRGIVLRDTIRIVVDPGPPAATFIEPTNVAADSAILRSPNPLDSIVIGREEVTNDQFYAILRDEFGNWVGPADDTQWSSGNSDIVTAATGPAPGQGIATRGEEYGVTEITAVSNQFPSNAVTVIVEKNQPPPQIDSAFYYDNSADGLVDEVIIWFNEEVEPQNMSLRFEWDGEISGAITGERITANNSSSVIVDIKNVFNDVSEPKTSGRMFVAVSQTGFSDDITGAVLDRAAPVVITATYRYGKIISDGITDADTLVVRMSEDIALQFSNSFPFNLSRSDGLTYSFNLAYLNRSNGVYRFIVYSTTPGQIYPLQGDSVYINPEVNMGDFSGNIQLNPANRRAILEMGELPFEWEFYVGPSPYYTGEMVFIPGLGQRQGVVFYATTLYSSNSPNQKIEGVLNIYDNVGNIVFHGIMDDVQENDRVVKVWDLKNRNGRVVATGTYLAHFKLSVSIDNQKYSKRQRAKFSVIND